MSRQLNNNNNNKNNNKQKQKMKKNAFDQVDKLKEKELDPKYKTELCKSFTETSFCIYGNKCRFAHGKNDLFDKTIEATNNNNYKQKLCTAFFENQYCQYGNRCHFKHDNTELKDIERSYYNYMIDVYP